MTDTDERVHRLFGNGVDSGGGAHWQASIVEQVVPINESAPQHPPITRDYISMARAISSICATRILLLIAVVTGAGIWAFAVYAPTNDRLAAAVAFSIVFVLPQVVLYLKKG